MKNIRFLSISNDIHKRLLKYGINAQRITLCLCLKNYLQLGFVPKFQTGQNVYVYNAMKKTFGKKYGENL